MYEAIHILLYTMYQGKPKLKQIKQTNLNNPSLNSQNMKGVFFEPTRPTIFRDELFYNPGFKDSLQRTVEQEQIKRYRQPNTPKESQSLEKEVPKAMPEFEPLHKRFSKNEVLDKITQLPTETNFQTFNYKGYQTIKSKQLRGFNIISNF